MITLREQLILVSNAYCSATGIGRGTVSHKVFKASHVLPNIEAGRDLQTQTFERAMQYFSDNWPARKAWPKGVKRPVPSAKVA